MTFKIKPFILSGFILAFTPSCGKKGDADNSLNISFATPTLSLSEANSSKSNSSDASATVYAPVYVYLTATDDHNDNITFTTSDGTPIGNGNRAVIPLNQSGSYSRNVPVYLRGITSAYDTVLTIKGHYLATSVQVADSSSDTLVNAAVCGTSSTPGNFLGTHSNSVNTSTLYIADLDKTPLTVTIKSGSGNAVLPISLSSIAVDKFAFKITTDGSSALTGAYVYVNDSSNVDTNSVMLNPCTGAPFYGVTDSIGRIATNLPIGVSSLQNPFRLSISNTLTTSETVSSSTLFNINTLTPSSNAVTTCSGLLTHYNSDGTPIFWKLNQSSPAGSTSAPMDPNSTTDTYLTASDIVTSNPSLVTYTPSICGRITAAMGSLNPRFADAPSAAASGPIQSNFLPINPNNAATFTAFTSGANYNYSLEATPTPGTATMVLLNPSAYTLTSSGSQNSLVAQQQVKVMCNIRDNTNAGIYVFGTSASNFVDCTSVGTTYNSSYSSGTRLGLSNYFFGALPSTNLTVNFYYQDQEGYLPYNKFTTVFFTSLVPANLTFTKI